MTTITISRQVGSGADQVANAVAERLGLRIFEKRLMAQVAEELGMSATELVDYSEGDYRRQNFIDALFRRRRKVEEVLSTWEGGEDGGDLAAKRILDEWLAIDLTRAAVEAAYQRGDVLIMGRGSQVILEGYIHVLHVRLVAPLESRVQRLCTQHKMTPPQARRLAAQRDQATAEYLGRFYNADPDDATLYHATFNTARCGVEKTAELICELV